MARVYEYKPAEGSAWIFLPEEDERLIEEVVASDDEVHGECDIVEGETELRQFTDFAHFHPNVPVLSGRAVGALRGMLEGCKLVPIRIPDRRVEYFALRVLRECVGVDTTRSDLVRVQSGRVVSVHKLVLAEDATVPPGFWKFKGIPGVYVDEAVVVTASSLELSGFGATFVCEA